MMFPNNFDWNWAASNEIKPRNSSLHLADSQKDTAKYFQILSDIGGYIHPGFWQSDNISTLSKWWGKGIWDTHIDTHIDTYSDRKWLTLSPSFPIFATAVHFKIWVIQSILTRSGQHKDKEGRNYPSLCFYFSVSLIFYNKGSIKRRGSGREEWRDENGRTRRSQRGKERKWWEDLFVFFFLATELCCSW